jgi:5'(3')-deoxyribonucleotidase
LETGKVFERSFPMDGALAGVQLWSADNLVYFVTYSHEDCSDGHAQKLAWMRMWLPWVREDQVIFTKHKFLVRGDVLIEDAPKNIEAWLAENPHGWAYIVDHPYNRSYSAARVTRVASVEEAYWQHAGQPLDQSFAATFDLNSNQESSDVR